MDFGASTKGFEARLCHLIFFLYLESNALILLKFWRLQPTLPCFGLQYSISKKTRTTVSISSMQGVFAECSLHKQAWRKPKEDRVGRLHQDIFMRKVTDPVSPASLYLTSPRPRPTGPHVPYLMSSSPSSRVPTSHTWCAKSPHTPPDVPVPLSPSHFYTQPFFRLLLTLETCEMSAIFCFHDQSNSTSSPDLLG